MCEKTYKVGYTTGVYDMFHIGHLRLLKQASNLVDKLIVGVTTDELCESYKGKKPVIPLNERMEIIQAIKGVYKVVPQRSYDKILAFEELKFNAMFVGSDWKGTDKWNLLEEEFRKKNVDIVYFEYTKDTSSTLIREKLLNL